MSEEFADQPIIPYIEPVGLSEPKVNDNLLKVIRDQVTRDGIDEKRISQVPGNKEDPKDVMEDAISTIYNDVNDFYAWYFNSDDDRTIWLGQKASQNFRITGNGDIQPIKWYSDVPAKIRDAVKPVVLDNLEAMREVGEIPDGQDTPSLDQIITDNLSKYIRNWAAWYYDRHEIEVVDDYFEILSMYENIYIDDDGYEATLSNLQDNAQYDGVTDVPFYGEPLDIE